MPTQYRTNPNNPLVPDAVEQTYEAVKSLDDGVSRAGAWAANRDNWIRVAKVTLGGALIIVGVGKLIAAPVAKTAATVGKVIK